MLEQLPGGMLEDELLGRLVRLFQDIAGSHLANVDQLEHVFDVAVAPDNMVRLMGRWIGVDLIDPVLPDELQRRIVGDMSRMWPWRGTLRGMKQFLELLSGEPATVEESGGIYREGEAPGRPPHVRMSVASSGWVDDDDLLQLVRRELPASVTFELHVGDRRLWPPEGRMAGEA